MPLGTRITGYAEVVPDLVVEVVSPNNSLREVNDKALMWLSYGARLVWVVNPRHALRGRVSGGPRSVNAHRE